MVPAGPGGCTGTMVGRPQWCRSCQTLPSLHHRAGFSLCLLLAEPFGLDPFPGHRDPALKTQKHPLIDLLQAQDSR